MTASLSSSTKYPSRCMCEQLLKCTRFPEVREECSSLEGNMDMLQLCTWHAAPEMGLP